MKYKILYKQYWGQYIYKMTHLLEIPDGEDADAVAKKRYEKFEKEMESTKTFCRYRVYGLVRIDQEEITTKII